MDFALITRIVPFLGEAALTTLLISALALVLGIAVASLITALRMSRLFPLRALATAYVSVMRGTPVLLQLFILYFGGPQLGIVLEPIPAGVICFGLNIAAYMSEGMRGAILAVDRGQTEAARTLGFGRWATMRHFILPQCAPLMLRSLGVNAVILIKGSALISTIGVVDLTYSAQRMITSDFRPFEIFGVAAVYYLVIVQLLTLAVNALERRLSLPVEARP